MLHAMLSGRFDTKSGEDGSYFIDRDGTHIRFILNYLRTGELIVPNDEIIHWLSSLLSVDLKSLSENHEEKLE